MKQVMVIISIWVCLMGALPANAAIEVLARVDRTDIEPGETLNLMVTIINGDGWVDTRAITAFKVIPRGTSTNMHIIDGKASRDVTHNYLLIPKAKGDLQIPALTVNMDGTTYHTELIAIRVNDQPADGSTRRTKDAFVEAEISDASPYVGQQVIYTFRLYNAVNIANAAMDIPEFKGFTYKEVEKRRTSRTILNGREYAVIEIYYILVPLAPGSVTIDPIMLQVDIEKASRRPQGRSSFERFFNDSMFRRGNYVQSTFQTEPVPVQVRPLPEPPTDLSFSGLVGRFELRSELDLADLKVGDSATLAITIQGQGNIMDAESPDLKLPSALKSYDDHPEEKIVLNQSGYSGQKIFRTALVPVQAGTVEFSPVRLTYFDIQEKAYRTLAATIPTMTIAASDIAQAGPITIRSEPQVPGKRTVDFIGRDILPPKEDLSAVRHQAPMGLGLFILGVLGPAMLFGAATLVQHIKRPDLSAAAVMKSKSRQALKAAHQADTASFLTHLYNALTAAIHAAAGRTGQALTWREAKAILLENGCPEPKAQQAAQLLTEIESSKFSGAVLSPDQRKALLAQVKQMTRTLAP